MLYLWTEHCLHLVFFQYFPASPSTVYSLRAFISSWCSCTALRCPSISAILTKYNAADTTSLSHMWVSLWSPCPPSFLGRYTLSRAAFLCWHLKPLNTDRMCLYLGSLAASYTTLYMERSSGTVLQPRCPLRSPYA